MNDKIKLLAWVAVCVLVIGGAALLYNKLNIKPQSPSLSEGAPDSFKQDPPNGDKTDNPTKALAPDFTVTDQNGNKVKLSDFKGKPVVINLWASWCGPCKSEMPIFDEVSKRYKDKIEFMMINLTKQDTIDDAKELIKEGGYGFPVFFDETGEVNTKYYTPGIPATFFVDANGGAVSYIVGAIDENTLEKGIEMIE